MAANNRDDGYEEVVCKKEVLYVFGTGEDSMVKTGKINQTTRDRFWKALPCFVGK